MARYYNRSQSPVPLSLNSGLSALIPPKGHETIQGADESSASLLAAINRGQIVKLPEKNMTSVLPTVEVPSVPQLDLSAAPPALQELVEPSKPWQVAQDEAPEEVPEATAKVAIMEPAKEDSPRFNKRK